MKKAPKFCLQIGLALVAIGGEWCNPNNRSNFASFRGPSEAWDIRAEELADPLARGLSVCFYFALS